MWRFVSLYGYNLLIVVMVEWSSLRMIDWYMTWYDENIILWFRLEMLWWLQTCILISLSSDAPAYSYNGYRNIWNARCCAGACAAGGPPKTTRRKPNGEPWRWQKTPVWHALWFISQFLEFNRYKCEECCVSRGVWSRTRKYFPGYFCVESRKIDSGTG